jgi:hypothetical protein
MATLPDGTAFAGHGVLIVEVQGNDLAHTWRSTMDLVWVVADGPPLYTDPSVAAFVDFIRGITRDDATIKQVSLYPWVKGKLPFADAGAIWQQTTNIACKNWGTGNCFNVATSSGAIPLGEVCVMYVKGKFASAGGKVGRMFLRNVIDGAAVTSDAGGPPQVLPADLAVFTTAVNAWANTKLSPYCTDNPLPRFCLVHASKLTLTPPAHDVFDSAMQVPQFERLTTHNLTKKSKK